MSAAANYLALTKPRLLPLVVLSSLPVFLSAGAPTPSIYWMLGVLVGISLAAGAANALNSYLERDLDARMERTRDRPLPARRIAAPRALYFGLCLSLAGTGLLLGVSGPLAALIALAAILFYVFVYTLWLKPRTPFAVIVGGVSGAIAPLIADAALDGSIGAIGWGLFAIIFVWQPPHFYAIALYRKAEYARAGFPMLHDQIGEDATRVRILAWSAVLIPVTLVPWWLGAVSGAYACAAAGLGAWFLGSALGLWKRQDPRSARRLFLVSLGYLMGIFAAMILDLAWRSLA